MAADIYGSLDIPTYVCPQLCMLSCDRADADEEDKEDPDGRGTEKCRVECRVARVIGLWHYNNGN